MTEQQQQQNNDNNNNNNNIDNNNNNKQKQQEIQFKPEPGFRKSDVSVELRSLINSERFVL